MSTQNELDFLTDESLHEAYEVEVKSKNGKSERFGELVAGKGETITTIVVFIRHFFCIYDQDYVRSLATQLTRELLDTIPPQRKPAQIIIIGCGDHTLIGPYLEETSDAYPIYTDPTGHLHEKLSMKRTYTGFSEPPPYSYTTFLRAFCKDLQQRWKRGWLGLRGGPGNQLGGEWIFERGKLKYVHRMQQMNDHLTAERLVAILNTDEKEGEIVSP